MASEPIRAHILAESLPYTTEHRLLAEVKALLVELLHETKEANKLLASDVEIARHSLLELKAMRAVLIEIRNALM